MVAGFVVLELAQGGEELGIIMHRVSLTVTATTFLIIAALSAIRNASAESPDHNWNGWYIGGHGGYGLWPYTNSVRVDSVQGLTAPGFQNTASGWFGGMQFGLNYPVSPQILAGIEADVSFAHIFDNILAPSGNPGASLSLIEKTIRGFGTLRGRIGWVNGDFLVFGTAGLAEINVSLKHTRVIGTLNFATPGTTETVTAWKTGWTIGGGLEAAISQKWGIKTEYIYLRSFSRWSEFLPLSLVYSDRDLGFHTVRVGLNYRL